MSNAEPVDANLPNEPRAERWLAEHKDGIAVYNALVEQHGAFADTLRTF